MSLYGNLTVEPVWHRHGIPSRRNGTSEATEERSWLQTFPPHRAKRILIIIHLMNVVVNILAVLFHFISLALCDQVSITGVNFIIKLPQWLIILLPILGCMMLLQYAFLVYATGHFRTWVITPSIAYELIPLGMIIDAVVVIFTNKHTNILMPIFFRAWPAAVHFHRAIYPFDFATSTHRLLMSRFGYLLALVLMFTGTLQFTRIAGTGATPSFLNILYFSIVTISTVGYGDISPISQVERFVITAEIIGAFLLLPLLLEDINSLLRYYREQRSYTGFNPHVVVIGQFTVEDIKLMTQTILDRAEIHPIQLVLVSRGGDKDHADDVIRLVSQTHYLRSHVTLCNADARDLATAIPRLAAARALSVLLWSHSNKAIDEDAANFLWSIGLSVTLTDIPVHILSSRAIAARVRQTGLKRARKKLLSLPGPFPLFKRYVPLHKKVSVSTVSLDRNSGDFSSSQQGDSKLVHDPHVFPEKGLVIEREPLTYILLAQALNAERCPGFVTFWFNLLCPSKRGIYSTPRSFRDILKRSRFFKESMDAKVEKLLKNPKSIWYAAYLAGASQSLLILPVAPEDVGKTSVEVARRLWITDRFVSLAVRRIELGRHIIHLNPFSFNDESYDSMFVLHPDDELVVIGQEGKLYRSFSTVHTPIQKIMLRNTGQGPMAPIFDVFEVSEGTTSLVEWIQHQVASEKKRNNETMSESSDPLSTSFSTESSTTSLTPNRHLILFDFSTSTTMPGMSLENERAERQSRTERLLLMSEVLPLDCRILLFSNHPLSKLIDIDLWRLSGRRDIEWKELPRFVYHATTLEDFVDQQMRHSHQHPGEQHDLHELPKVIPVTTIPQFFIPLSVGRQERRIPYYETPHLPATMDALEPEYLAHIHAKDARAIIILSLVPGEDTFILRAAMVQLQRELLSYCPASVSIIVLQSNPRQLMEIEPRFEPKVAHSVVKLVEEYSIRSLAHATGSSICPAHLDVLLTRAYLTPGPSEALLALLYAADRVIGIPLTTLIPESEPYPSYSVSEEDNNNGSEEILHISYASLASACMECSLIPLGLSREITQTDSISDNAHGKRYFWTNPLINDQDGKQVDVVLTSTDILLVLEYVFPLVNKKDYRIYIFDISYFPFFH